MLVCMSTHHSVLHGNVLACSQIHSVVKTNAASGNCMNHEPHRQAPSLHEAAAATGQQLVSPCHLNSTGVGCNPLPSASKLRLRSLTWEEGSRHSHTRTQSHAHASIQSWPTMLLHCVRALLLDCGLVRGMNDACGCHDNVHLDISGGGWHTHARR